MHKILFNRIMMTSRAVCTYDAFAETFIMQVPTVSISYYYRRQTKGLYDVSGLVFNIAIQPRGVIAQKIEKWRLEGKSELQIANELSNEVYVNSILNYIEADINNPAAYFNNYGITCGFLSSTFATYVEFLNENHCQKALEDVVMKCFGEKITGIDYHWVIINAY